MHSIVSRRMSDASSRISVMALAATAIVSCGNRDHRVPYQQEVASKIEKAAAPTVGLDASLPLPTATAFQDGAPSIAVEGATVSLPSALIRSALPMDIDGDGDRDVVLTSTDAENAVTLSFARRNGTTFEVAKPLKREVLATGCNATSLDLRALPNEWLEASIGTRCENASKVSENLHWLLRAPRTPSPVLTLRHKTRDPRSGMLLSILIGPTDGEPMTADLAVVRIKLSSDDGRTQTFLDLTWSHHGGAWVKNPAQPATKLAELAKTAAKLAQDQPEQAMSLASLAAAYFAVLCRQSQEPEVEVNGRLGASCEPATTDAVASALATLVSIHVKRKNVKEALNAYRTFEQTEALGNHRERPRVERLLLSLPPTEPSTLRPVVTPGPVSTPATSEGVRISALGFVDDNTLLVRGDSPRLIDLATGQTKPDTTMQDGRVRDPSKTFQVFDMRRSCAGVRLRIASQASIVAGVLAGKAVSEVLLDDERGRAGTNCEGSNASVTSPKGPSAFHILGWAPQGIVAVRGDEVRSLPMTVAAAPAGPATVLPPGTALPAPLPPSEATSDGRALARVTPFGVLIHERYGQGALHLLRPAGFVASVTSNVALAPSMKRVAFVREGRIFVIDIGSTSEPHN